MSKVNIHLNILDITLAIMIVALSLFFLGVLVLFVNDVYNTVLGEPCVCEEAD